MSLFFISFITIYGGMNYYVYHRLSTAYSLGPLAKIIFCLMTLAPFLVRVIEQFDNTRLAFLIAWPAYVWLGMIFLFCIVLLVFNLIHAFSWLASVFLPHKYLPGFSSATACKTALILTGMATLYSLYEARSIKTEHIVLHVKQSTANWKPLRIVQISDLHLGLLLGEGRLKKIINTITAAHPDILVSTGDLVDGRISSHANRRMLHTLAAQISKIPAISGKYAIMGNHEFYAGINDALDVTKSAGFTVLRNETVVLPSGLIISGIDDPAAERMGFKSKVSEAELLKNLPAGAFYLLLKHRPILQHKSDGFVDLQLSGHTHKGQLIPFYPLTWITFPIHSGTTKTAHGTTVHVSRGTGTWGPPMRFLAAPEVTIIDILP